MTTPCRPHKLLSGALFSLAALGLPACQDATSPPPDRETATTGGVAMVMHSVPFRARYLITPQLLLPGDPGYPARCPTGPTSAAGPATGQGHATHLGRVTESESTCIDFSTLALTLGEWRFTAANGDQLYGTFEGSASFDPPPPNAILSCTWEITGGTGRFIGATGDGDCVDSRQLGNGQSSIGFAGSIAYDAANHSTRS